MKQITDGLRERLNQALQQAKTEELKKLQQDWERLLMDVEALVRSADQLIGVPAQPPAAAERLQKTIEQANQLRKITDKLMSDAQGGLVPIDIHVDDAMVNAVHMQEGYAQVATYAPDARHVDDLLALQREAMAVGRAAPIR